MPTLLRKKRNSLLYERQVERTEESTSIEREITPLAVPIITSSDVPNHPHRIKNKFLDAEGEVAESYVNYGCLPKDMALIKSLNMGDFRYASYCNAISHMNLIALEDVKKIHDDLKVEHEVAEALAKEAHDEVQVQKTANEALVVVSQAELTEGDSLKISHDVLRDEKDTLSSERDAQMKKESSLQAELAQLLEKKL
ncbi:hypothetical protein NE237_004747 [Protea cynaroides]|uniref:Uncharacterized protein n=1 Tax=Protea cynaroides TaxID=273540 RepID=A0A9Q0KJ90_9MAGN|nr:hypothetical protein NE237_004747 [Protea cynaroides]